MSGDVTMPWAPARVQRRLREIQRGTVPGSDEDLERSRGAAESARLLLDGDDALVFYAGTNAVAPAVAQAHDPWLGSRAICGWPGDVVKPGLPGMHDLEVLEVLAARAVAAAMGAAFADVRPQSATLANLAVFAALAPVGATIASLPASAGGHFSHRTRGAAGIRGHRVVDVPFDAERQDVDLARLAELPASQRPALVVLGASVQPFPCDVAGVAEIAHVWDARLVCDVSHQAGLIPGGAFPNPLRAGADVATFSTYKSFGGPPGGAIVTDDAEIARRVDEAIFPGLTANYDTARLRPLHVAAVELLRDGRRYGERCVACARALAEALAADGLPVMAAARGFTATNQVLVRMPDEDAAKAAMLRCAVAGVFLSVTEYGDEHGPTAALRLGVQELVRRGLEPSAIAPLAELLGGLVRDELSGLDARGAIRRLAAAEWPVGR